MITIALLVATRGTQFFLTVLLTVLFERDHQKIAVSPMKRSTNGVPGRGIELAFQKLNPSDCSRLKSELSNCPLTRSNRSSNLLNVAHRCHLGLPSSILAASR